MNQTIERLQSRIAELEAENANLLAANRDCIEHFNAMQQDLAAARQIIDEENKDHIEQLAASQLSNQQLREALEKTRGALAYVKANGRDNPNLMESTAWHGLAAADKALTQPTSTEALDVYVAEWQPIETAPNGEAVLLARIDGDYLHWATDAKKSRIGFWSTLNGRSVNEPTHWMPLPTPPKLSMEGV